MIIPSQAIKVINFLYPSLTFQYLNSYSTLFLTFDDGPVPGVTDFVLKSLKDYKARATFFCLGENAEVYTGLYKQIILEGHLIGNHSWNHPDAFRVNNSDFFKNIERADKIFASKLFRPPFGRLWPWQIHRLSKKYNIVMWNVMIPDFKSGLDGDKMIRRLTKNLHDGSIIVMHDSLKSSKNLFYILPRILEEFTGRGFKFASIPFTINEYTLTN
jgi:peptidoglycan-N-acetylglucosamine deacetylase